MLSEKVKIALIGPYPPPFGGISIHIQRLKEQLAKRGYNCVVYAIGAGSEFPQEDIKRIKNIKSWLPSYFMGAREDIIHLHCPSLPIRAIISLMGMLGRKTVITIHGASLEDSFSRGNWFKKQIIKFIMKQFSFIIVLNSKMEEFASSLGVKRKRLQCVPSFIPPIIKESEIDDVPKEVWFFLDSHKPTVLANASRIAFYNGEDLYGIDMCVDLCAALKQSYPKIGFVFCLPEISDYGYFEKIKQRIREKGIKENFLFQTKPCQMYPILKRSDLFVRPTNTDGYSISVAEAIYFKVPALASDVCPRPQGAILFKSRDINDLTLKAKDILDNYLFYKRQVEDIEFEDNTEKILGIYKQLI